MWPWSKFEQLEQEAMKGTAQLNAATVYIDNQHVVIDELKSARKGLVQLCKARKDQIRSLGAEPVKLYDTDETGEDSPRQKMLGVG